jgi:hypothetical protein
MFVLYTLKKFLTFVDDIFDLDCCTHILCVSMIQIFCSLLAWRMSFLINLKFKMAAKFSMTLHNIWFCCDHVFKSVAQIFTFHK